MESTAGGMESVADGMESRAKGYEEYSLTADAIRGRAAMPYNSQSELMPYQALRSWIKITASKEAVIFWWAHTKGRYPRGVA